MATVLIVDDEESICWSLKRLVTDLGHQPIIASSAEAAIDACLANKPQMILLDIRLPRMSGLAAMAQLRQASKAAPVVIMTAYGQLETAVEAIKQGAVEYLVKPFELATVQQAIERAIRSTVEIEDGTLTTTLANQLVGQSAPMQEVFRRIALVAPTTASVHISGESGTGKELIARAIHQHGPRSNQPFIPVNLAALSPGVAESELFGHMKGAFTGADATRAGLFEQANAGTLFLDEVADIPPSLQVKLLRVLDDGEVWPVGSNRPVSVDVRIISATHQQLESLIESGKFRHDLYFRLNTFRIASPPLRDRQTDIVPLANHFLQLAGQQGLGSKATLSSPAQAELQRRHWPGNVRELKGVIEHAAIVARGMEILPEHLPPASEWTTSQSALAQLPIDLREAAQQWAANRLRDLRQAPVASGQGANLYEEFLAEVEPGLFQAALDANRQQVAPAARQLGIHRTTLARKIADYGLQSIDT